MAESLSSLKFKTALKLNRLARDDIIDVRERLEELGPKSAAKGLAIAALRHVPLNYASISERMLRREDAELVGAGSHAAVYLETNGTDVTKYFLSGQHRLETDVARHRRATSLTAAYFTGVAVPAAVDSASLPQTAFVTHRQAYVRERRDIFSMSDEIAGHKGPEYLRLRRQVGVFLSQAMALSRQEEAFPDLNGPDNLSVETGRRPELKLLDLMPVRYESVRGMNRFRRHIKALEDIAA